MWIWFSLLAFAIGVLARRLSERRYRRDRIAWAQRRLQLKVLSLEVKSQRSKVVSAQGSRTPPAKRHLVSKRSACGVIAGSSALRYRSAGDFRRSAVSTAVA